MYEHIKIEVNTYAKHYTTRREIREAIRSQELLPSIIDGCLDEYGAKIWYNGNGEPYFTSLDEYYPRHLIFEQPQDRER